VCKCIHVLNVEGAKKNRQWLRGWESLLPNKKKPLLIKKQKKQAMAARVRKPANNTKYKK